jgi:hypothetical protein
MMRFNVPYGLMDARVKPGHDENLGVRHFPKNASNSPISFFSPSKSAAMRS